MRESKYKEGYQPKIEYYQALLSIAVDRLQIEKIKFYTTKLEYFVERQAVISERLANLYE